MVSGQIGEPPDDSVHSMISFLRIFSRQAVEIGVAGQLTVDSNRLPAGIAEINRPPDGILSLNQPWLTRCGHQALQIGEASQPVAKSGCRAAEITEDGILCSILSSSLTMRDAVRTSILSRRWKNLWTYIPNLVFDAQNMLEPDPALPYFSNNVFFDLSRAEQKAVTQPRRERFVRYVDEFLRHHQGSGVILFKVCFRLNEKHAGHLNQWMEFAVTSGAKKLVLHLHEPGLTWSTKHDPYDFPFHLFADGGGSSVETLHLTYCTFSLPATFAGFSSLKNIYLSYIYMTDADMDILLSVCSVIESLIIYHIEGLANLRISHRSGRLKSFSVKLCPHLMKIELNSIILTWFQYRGVWPVLSLKNTSRIMKAHILMRDTHYAAKYSLTELAGDFPQLEDLFIDLLGPIEVGLVPSSYRFTHLKQLALFATINQNSYALDLGLFLSFAPSLEKFHVNMRVESPRGVPKELPPKCIHNNLKQFEVSGFDGDLDEIYLVLYVLKSAVALELVTLDPSTWFYTVESGWENFIFQCFLTVRANHNAQFLSTIAQSAGVKFVIR